VFIGVIQIFVFTNSKFLLLMKTIGKFLSTLSIAVLGGVAALTLNHFYASKQYQWAAESQMRNPLPVKFVGLSSTAAMPENNTSFVTAAQKSVPAVVYIESTVEMEGQPTYNNMLDYLYGNPHTSRMEGRVSGSGVVVSADGYIVTNNHVVEEGNKLKVTLSNRQTYDAKVIGKDPATDLALLKIDAQNLPFMEYGNSDETQIGQWVLAVGNPYNLTSTVTAGIISAKGRNIDILPQDRAHKMYPIESYIQTDAAVNPGNSGGALVNTDGQLIGINSAIASPTGSYSGYSFAIPVNLVRKVVADLLQYGVVQRAVLGVTIRTVDADLAKEKNLNSTAGVYIDAASANGAAEEGGIKSGDVIVKVGDQPVNDVASLEEQIGGYRPGDKVNITVSRHGNMVSVPVTLRNLDGNTAIEKPIVSSTDNKALNELGASFASISKTEAQKLHIDNGVKVTDIGEGKLASIGVEKGFIITKLNHQKVGSADDIQKIIENGEGGILVEGVYPNGMKAYYAFGI
jgi:serine protease Do